MEADVRRTRFSTLAALVVASLAVVLAASPAAAAPVSDNFNRSNSTDLGAGWTETGNDLAITGNQLTNPANNTGFAQAVGGTGNTAAAKVTAAAGGNAFNYAAVAVRVADATDMVMVRVQDNDADGTFDHLIGTRGNGTGAVIFNDELAAEFSTGRLTVRSDGTDVTAGIDTTNDGVQEEVHTAPLPSEATGTGVGVGVANNAALDDFASSDTGQTTTTTLQSSANPSELGETVTFTATVTPATSGTPTGSVVFSINAVDQAPVALSGGEATFGTDTLAEGSSTIVARYVPDTFDFLPSTSDPLNQAVFDHQPTTTDVESDLNPSFEGDTVTLTATVSTSSGTPTGNVTFFDGLDSVATVALDGAGTASLTTSTLTPGIHLITAEYGGDATYEGSDDAINQVVLGDPPRPDGRVRRGQRPLLGNDVHNTDGTGQTAAGAAHSGQTISYRVSIQNDAVVPEVIAVHGQGSTNLFTVTYRNQTGTNITRQVVDGSYRTRELAPGKVQVLKVTVLVRGAAAHGSTTTRTVTLTATRSDLARDVVRFTARRP
jgi:hypothetical protein